MSTFFIIYNRKPVFLLELVDENVSRFEPSLMLRDPVTCGHKP